MNRHCLTVSSISQHGYAYVCRCCVLFYPMLRKSEVSVTLSMYLYGKGLSRHLLCTPTVFSAYTTSKRLFQCCCRLFRHCDACTNCVYFCCVYLITCVCFCCCCCYSLAICDRHSKTFYKVERPLHIHHCNNIFTQHQTTLKNTGLRH